MLRLPFYLRPASCAYYSCILSNLLHFLRHPVFFSVLCSVLHLVQHRLEFCPASCVPLSIQCAVQYLSCYPASTSATSMASVLSSVLSSVHSSSQGPVTQCPVLLPVSLVRFCAILPMRFKIPRSLQRPLQRPASCPTSYLRSSIPSSSVQLPCNCDPLGVHLMKKPLWLVSQQGAELGLPTANVLFDSTVVYATTLFYLAYFCMQTRIAYQPRVYA